MGMPSYLALAGIIAAGAKGIVDQASLTVKDLSTCSAAEISPEERAALGVKNRMSLSVEEARQRFKDDSVLREMLSDEVVDAYLNVNKVDSSFFKFASKPIRLNLSHVTDSNGNGGRES